MKVTETFRDTPVFQVEGRADHILNELLLISLCEVLNGAEDLEEIDEYGIQK